jgi:hypothetical protein
MKTDLLSSELERGALTFFALGGSGARTVEPLLHLCAMGLGPRRLRLVIIDPDQANAGVTRARQLLDLYRQTRQELGGGTLLPGYFRTEILDPVAHTLVWSPIADDEHLPSARFAARVDRPAMEGSRTAGLAHLHDVLFAERLREMDLRLGFRGIPAIGTVFMNRLRTEPFFEQLLTDAGQEPDMVFFSVGSIFGGTGAAGLPVVGRSLSDGLRGREERPDVPGVDQRRVGAALLLPYFTLPVAQPSNATRGEVRPETALFMQNAAAALPTYLNGGAGYGGLYVLGDDDPREQPVNEVGGQQQANPAHYVELFAALAALDFAARQGESAAQRLPVFRYSAVRHRNLGWEDLPISDRSLRRMMGSLVAMHTYLSIFRPDGKPRPGLARLLRGSTWMESLRMKSDDLEQHGRALDLLGSYFQKMWSWMAEMRGSTPALQVAGVDGRDPTRLGLHETLEHRAGGRDRNSRTIKDPYSVFRHWNDAAYGARGQGLPALLEVMRNGSERFANEWFAAPDGRAGE